LEARRHKETNSNFLSALKNQLNKPLPGLDAQFELAPEGRINEYPDLNKLKEHKQGAVCILLFLKENELYFPLIKRTDYKGVHSGQIALPGGKFEESDSDLINTALRETQEEIGINIERSNVLGILSSLYIPPSNYLVYPIVSFIDYDPEFSIQGEEVAELIEYPMKKFMDQKIQVTEVNASSNGKKITTPYFDIDGKVLWGATAMILNEFRWVINSLQKNTKFHN
jgi:8-oxo-dGTP pyrophosphatase MutT (NUDIX family)